MTDTSDKTTIILVIGDLMTAASGPNEVVRHLAKWLTDREHDVIVAGTWGGNRPNHTELRELYGNARVFAHKRYFKDSWHISPAAFFYGVRLLFQRTPFLVDIHSPWLFNGLVISLAAKIKRQKYFVKAAGNFRQQAMAKSGRLKRLALSVFFKQWLSRANAVTALNDQEALEAATILKEVRFVVIPNGARTCGEALAGPRRKEILFLGRIDPIKNLEALITGFGLVSDQFPEWCLRIVGPAADRAYLQDLRLLAASINGGNRVTFDGPAYGDLKESAYLAVSLFALTSWSEGMPNAVLEAMAHGLPVIVSDQCNLNVPQSCGRVCGCMSPDIAAGLGELLSLSSDRLRSMGSAAYEFVERTFSEDSVFEQRLSMYFSEDPQQKRQA